MEAGEQPEKRSSNLASKQLQATMPLLGSARYKHARLVRYAVVRTACVAMVRLQQASSQVASTHTKHKH